MATDDRGLCSGDTKRRGVHRPCAQRPIVYVNGRWWCYYHNPDAPRKFGEGYLAHHRVKPQRG